MDHAEVGSYRTSYMVYILILDAAYHKMRQHIETAGWCKSCTAECACLRVCRVWYEKTGAKGARMVSWRRPGLHRLSGLQFILICMWEAIRLTTEI